MRKHISWLFLVMGILLLGFVVAGCGKTTETAPSTPETTPTTPNAPSGVTASNLFNVSGAKAIASAQKSSTSGGSIKSLAEVTPDDVVKLTASGSIESIFNSQLQSWSYSWRPTIQVIEKGPDGSFYVGFASRLSFYVYTSTEEGYYNYQQGAAFYRIKPDASVEVVDNDIEGMGSWYSSYSYYTYSILPAKQVQFDSAGNVYYLGLTTSSSGYYSSSSNTLKKKTTAGVTSSIGSSSHMYVRDFLVVPSGWVLWHGSNVSSGSIDYTKEWLRVFTGSSTYNIFYNDMSSGSYGYLRTYWLDKNNNVYLVGSNLNIEDPTSGLEKKYSGIIRVRLNSTTGQPTSVEALYDDNNMYYYYSASYYNIGNQIVYGYWDYSAGTYKKFFKTDSWGSVTQPLTLESGITEDTIRSYIRSKYYQITSDTLNTLTLEGFSTSETLANAVDAAITSRISGTTWATWMQDNGLTGVSFGSAEQILFAEDGSVYAVMNLDNWGTTSKGDKLFCIINAYGSAEPVAYPQHSSYLTISKAYCYGDYIVYLTSKGGYYRIFRYDLTGTPAQPTDMTSGKSMIEIYSFTYSPSNGLLYYDVYDYGTNSSYLVEQLITSLTASSETTSSGYTLKDVVAVSFEATPAPQ